MFIKFCSWKSKFRSENIFLNQFLKIIRMYEFSKCSNCYILYLHSLGIEASSGKSTWNKYCAIRYYFKINAQKLKFHESTILNSNIVIGLEQVFD